MKTVVSYKIFTEFVHECFIAFQLQQVEKGSFDRTAKQKGAPMYI